MRKGETPEVRVLHINCNYLTTPLHQTMIEHLDAVGIKNTVIAPTSNAKDRAIVPNKNVFPAECFKRQDRFLFHIKQAKIIRAVKNLVQVTDYDVIHAYTLFTDGNSAYELSRQYGIPYVVAVRNTDFNFFSIRINLRRRGIKILENASVVFFMSEIARNKFIDSYVPESKRQRILQKCRVVPNGIDDFWIKNKYTQRSLEQTAERISHQDLQVICVARIIKQKNIPRLQEALNLLRADGWKVRLTVVGKIVDQDEFDIIQKDVNSVYHAPVSKDKLIDLYREADIFVLPSHGETFGLVYAEAMSQALPVVYTQGEGFDGQFPEGYVGYHTVSESAEDIANKIKMVCENYTAMGNNCMGAVDKFLWNDICTGYKNIYENMIDQ